ncbi:mannose-1-phosphate guanylyltransferase [bacterium]|nr:mannose-1-phosphate guanylyltransferase [bacterium]
MKKENLIAVCVMAGGIGERFWPLSRTMRPKQLLAITGERTMLRETIARHAGLSKPEDVYIITTKEQAGLIEKETAELPKGNVIPEPCGRNTAPCVALAAALLYAKDPESVMVVVSSDHHIPDSAAYRATIEDAIALARQEHVLVTIGVVPRYPETGYGYIKGGEEIAYPGKTKAMKVSRFLEKPPLAVAEELYKTPGVFWNAGMFVFNTKDILSAFERFMPESNPELKEIVRNAGKEGERAAIENYYRVVTKISIDNAVLEKADNVAVLAASFQWNDVGSWTSASSHWPEDGDGNRLKGEIKLLESEDCIVGNYHEGLVGVIGLKDVVVIRTGDAVLVCAKDKVQDVKKLLNGLDEKYR